ncbi:hypothetical protein FHS87_004237, partial [Roseomonas pecuniae]|nr:hypothetical protein [Roseomonas pecuniae]
SARTRYRRAATPASAPQEPRIERHHGKTIENVWEYLRQNLLSHRVWDSYDAIVDACCHAWSNLMSTPEQIASITRRSWTQVKV